MPQSHALGIGLGSQWEVLGTFNIDPSLLSTLVAATNVGGQNRLLWEWRPSWMPAERSAGDLVRRPYYVIARIPASLAMALHARQGISQSNALQRLQVLGQRGIGLGVLNAEGGTQESAAAGYFYAVQLLSPVTGDDPFGRLSAAARPAVYGVLPIDPIEAILQGMAGRRLDRRADLLGVAALREDGTLQICIVPVEVKHHGMPGQPEELPTPTHGELRRVRQQLEETVALLQEIINGLVSSAGAERLCRALHQATRARHPPGLGHEFLAECAECGGAIPRAHGSAWQCHRDRRGRPRATLVRARIGTVHGTCPRH